jgi:outer membrane protein
MKNLVLYIINGVLVVAVVVLFILFFINKEENSKEQALTEGEVLPIAYVNIDTLLLNYDLYKSMSEELLQEEERSRASVNQKANALQAEMVDFQNKIENRAFLSEERARSEQERLVRKQRELQELDNKLAQDLVVKQKNMNDKLFKTLDSVVTVYNKDKKYHFIFSNTSSNNILYGNKAYNITNEILELLNEKK